MEPSCANCRAVGVLWYSDDPAKVVLVINRLWKLEHNPASYVYTSGDCVCDSCYRDSHRKKCAACQQLSRPDLLIQQLVVTFMQLVNPQYIYVENDCICRKCYNTYTSNSSICVVCTKIRRCYVANGQLTCEGCLYTRQLAKCVNCQEIKRINANTRETVTRHMLVYNPTYEYQDGDKLCSNCSHVDTRTVYQNCVNCNATNKSVRSCIKNVTICSKLYPKGTPICSGCKAKSGSRTSLCVCCQGLKPTSQTKIELTVRGVTFSVGSMLCGNCRRIGGRSILASTGKRSFDGSTFDDETTASTVCV